MKWHDVRPVLVGLALLMLGIGAIMQAEALLALAGRVAKLEQVKYGTKSH
jgi:hypothetical protein